MARESTQSTRLVIERLDSLERSLGARLDLLQEQVAGHRDRIGRLEASQYTPLPEPVGGRATTGRVSPRSWRRHAVELGLQLGFVLALVAAGALLLGRQGTLGWQEIAGLALLGAVIAGRDVRGLFGLRGPGGGGGGAAAAGGVVLLLAALSSGCAARQVEDCTCPADEPAVVESDEDPPYVAPYLDDGDEP